MTDEPRQPRTPRLRFPEFQDTGEWEEKEVGEIFRATRGEVLPMTLVKDIKTNDNPYPVYSSQTKNNGLSGFYSEYLYEDAITWTTDGANAGDVNYRPGKFFCTNVCGVLINTEGYANACVAAIINSVSKNYVSYVGNPKLMNGVMSKITIFLPSLAEQRKIAECLGSLDAVITAQRTKLDALTSHKQGLMQQLFPAEGETVPRLRFPEFHDVGEWVGQKIIDIAKFSSGGTPAKDVPEYWDGMIPWISASSMYDTNITTSELKITDLAVSNGARIAKKGSLLILVRGSMLYNRVPMGIAATDVAFNQDVKSLSIHSAVNTTFLLYELLAFESKIPINKTGIGAGKIETDDLEQFPISIPSLPEQQKIAECLGSLDAIISAEKEKLAALLDLKQGLMQQLFPMAEEVDA